MSEQQIQAGPVVKVARDLTEIVTMAGMLAEEAVYQGDRQVDGKVIPGGLAMVALGNVANLESWEYQYEAAERAGRDVRHVEDEDDTWEPPLQTLCFWSEQWRAEHGAEYDTRPTLGSEAAFIRWALDWAWENELHWDDFAGDIRRARVRLENLLHAGKRAERTRVPCTSEMCERKPRLIRVYRESAADDGYRCTACKSWYDAHDFARAKLQHLTHEGADRHVKMQDARDAIDRPRRTWDKWLRLWYVRSYRDAVTGQVWVWWPDVREADQEVNRRRARSA